MFRSVRRDRRTGLGRPPGRARPPWRGSTAVPVMIAVLAAVSVAGCRGSSEEPQVASAGGAAAAPVASPGPARSADREEQLRQFTACMREQGIDMPDPEPGAGGGRIRIGGPDGGDDPQQAAKTEQAMQVCRSLLPNGGEPPKLDAEQQEQFQRFAQCMREHGVDMPDPEPGTGRIIIRRSGGPDPNDPDFEAAQQACQDLRPRLDGQDRQ